MVAIAFNRNADFCESAEARRPHHIHRKFCYDELDEKRRENLAAKILRGLLWNEKEMGFPQIQDLLLNSIAPIHHRKGLVDADGNTVVVASVKPQVLGKVLCSVVTAKSGEQFLVCENLQSVSLPLIQSPQLPFVGTCTFASCEACTFASRTSCTFTSSSIDTIAFSAFCTFASCMFCTFAPGSMRTIFPS